jgi:putative flippase GtrA
MTPEGLWRWLNQGAPREFARFTAVGAVATATHYTLMIALKELGHVNVVVATICGYALGAVVSYTLNRRFTFSTRPAYGRGLAKFLAVTCVGAVLNAAIVALLTNQGLYYMLAQVIATGLVLIWNFTGARLLVFRA